MLPLVWLKTSIGSICNHVIYYSMKRLSKALRWYPKSFVQLAVYPEILVFDAPAASLLQHPEACFSTL